MPENAGRFAAVLYDQFEEDRVADWGGDDLFTRMPSPRPVDDAPAPRFRRTLTLVETPEERRHDGRSEHAPATLARDNRTGPGDRRAPARSISGPLRAEPTTRERAERLGLAVVDPSPVEGAPQPEPSPVPLDLPPLPSAAAESYAEPAFVRQWDESLDPGPGGRPTRVITGRPDGLPRPLRASSEHRRRRPSRTPAEWIGARPERIVAWAFVLGLLLILIAISTADAATL